ncbi:hypothetical protein PUMCH_001577 [Australozyma saopauloensis]|uniref:Uncharacterized protein n=1 Tax=Australozyma saopauloensis TaxID=291208 RepID=A0AAX4H7S2_9ASCO|nr:hypothetical protein PUMCH_001577 [[Candida] saopauloensis]
MPQARASTARHLPYQYSDGHSTMPQARASTARQVSYQYLHGYSTVPQTPTAIAQQIFRQRLNGAPEVDPNFTDSASRSVGSSRSKTLEIDPQEDSIGTQSEHITDENEKNLRNIVKLLIRKISEYDLGRLSKSFNCKPVYRALAGCNGVYFLQSMLDQGLRTKLESLCKCLQKIDLSKFHTEGSRKENQESAVDLVKQLIARPGKVPTDAEALTLVDGLKTPEGRAFLRNSPKLLDDSCTKKVWFHMLNFASEFLCASRFEIEKIPRRTWDYTDPLIQQLVKVFASQSGFKAFKRLLLYDQYAELLGPFLEDFLESEIQSNLAFFAAISSDTRSLNAVFDALWTKPGVFFVCACNKQDQVPKPWIRRFRRPNILETPAHGVIVTDGGCLRTRYQAYESRNVPRRSSLCPDWQKQFFHVARNDTDLLTASHIVRIRNHSTIVLIESTRKDLQVSAAHLTEVISIIECQSEFLKAMYTKTEGFIEENCEALVAMKNGDIVTFKPAEFLDLAEEWEQGYTSLVEQNIASLVEKFVLDDLRSMTSQALRELTEFNTETQTRFSLFLKNTRYIVHVLEGGRLYFEWRRNAGRKTIHEGPIFLMDDANSTKNVKSTVASIQNGLLIFKDNDGSSAWELKFSRFLDERLMNEFLMTWSEELLEEPSPLLDWVGDAEIAQLGTLLFRPGHVNIPFLTPTD